MTTPKRRNFLQELHSISAQKGTIVGAGAGTGLVAKSAAHGGADFIAVYCTSKARHRGHPTSIIGDPNEITLDLVDEVATVVEDTPIVAGLWATDPTRCTRRLLSQLVEAGCAGVINYPSMGLYGREYIGGPVDYHEGLSIEAEVLQRAREAGLVAMTYTYRPSEAKFFAEVADVVVAHAGWTTGGFAGAPEKASHTEAAAAVNAQVDVALRVRPDLICLGHGGPFARPEDTAELYRLTAVQGFLGASSIERIPIERAVSETVRDFKNVSTDRDTDRKSVSLCA